MLYEPSKISALPSTGVKKQIHNILRNIHIVSNQNEETTHHLLNKQKDAK